MPKSFSFIVHDAQEVARHHEQIVGDGDEMASNVFTKDVVWKKLLPHSHDHVRGYSDDSEEAPIELRFVLTQQLAQAGVEARDIGHRC